MRYLPNLLKFYCSVNFERCGALAKISLSILCKSVFIASKDFELTDQEVDFVLELLSSVIYKQENIQYTWIAYTTDSNDSVYYFITFCLHLVANSSNAVKMLKVGIMDCIIYLFQHYEQEMPLKVALQLLAKLSAVVKLSAESHSSLINSLQQLMQKDTMKLDAFYCLLSLGIDVPKLIGQRYMLFYILKRGTTLTILSAFGLNHPSNQFKILHAYDFCCKWPKLSKGEVLWFSAKH